MSDFFSLLSPPHPPRGEIQGSYLYERSGGSFNGETLITLCEVTGLFVSVPLGDTLDFPTGLIIDAREVSASPESLRRTSAAHASAFQCDLICLQTYF